MKGVAVIKANHSHNPSRPMNVNMTHKAVAKKALAVHGGPDGVVASQAQYIDNLQQQVYFLENEIGYLRTHMEESNKTHPSMLVEAENMVKKLTEAQKEIQGLKVEVRRKQTSLDLIKSEKERLLRKMEEAETIHNTQKSACLEELVELRKERDDFVERSIELDRTLKEANQHENNLQEDLDSLHTQMEDLKREMSHDKESIERYKENIEQLQKELFDTKMKLEAKSACDKEASLKLLKTEVQELQEQVQTAERSAEHERLLRGRLAEDNALLIKRHADLEGELAEVKALLREEQGLRSSLETVQLKIVVDASETKARDVQLKAEVDNLSELLKAEKELCFQLATQLADEQRFKTREEQKVMHLERRLEQREDRMKTRERENTELQRDNAFLKDQVLVLQQQLKDRDNEVEILKQKVQEMQISVEEFIQSNHAANRLQGQRWKQLTQLAQGIQSLSQKAAVEQEI